MADISNSTTTPRWGLFTLLFPSKQQAPQIDQGGFEPAGWLHRAVLIGYRFEVVEGADGDIRLMRWEPTAWEWEPGGRPSSKGLWEELGATAAEREANNRKIDAFLMKTDFAHRRKVLGQGLFQIVYGTQPQPRGARWSSVNCGQVVDLTAVRS